MIGYDPKLIGNTPIKSAELVKSSSIMKLNANNNNLMDLASPGMKVFKDESDVAVKKRSNISQLSFVTLTGKEFICFSISKKKTKNKKTVLNFCCFTLNHVFFFIKFV